MSITHTANPGRHSIVARKDDLHETPSEAVSIVDAVDASEAMVAEAKAKMALGAWRSSV